MTIYVIKYIYLEKGLIFLCGFSETKPLAPPLSKGHAERGRLDPFVRTDNKIGGAEMRVKITLACTECKQRNYNTKKNKKNDPDRIEMNKYCRFCRKHTLHRETK